MEEGETIEEATPERRSEPMTARSIRPAAETLGTLGTQISIDEMRAKTWDAIVVGGGHNGLTCAAYLAREGRSVLVLEARDRIGGACSLKELWPGYRISPCAYLVGLLHPRVVADLGLVERGLSYRIATSGMFVPFEDGSSIQLWDDEQRMFEEIQKFSPRDVSGLRAMIDLKRKIRDALRPEGDRDLWLTPPPSRSEIEARLNGDPDAIGLLFDWSMAEFVERYLTDERLQIAYLGQGVIGTNASPFDRGTASIHFHHQSGRLSGEPGAWGYVIGGMGMISFLICDAARELGAVVATGVRIARIVPDQGVELDSGDRIHARVIVSNADPITTLRLLGDAADPGWKKSVESIPIRGRTLKVNIALGELPNFQARPGTFEPHHHGQINTPLSKQEWIEGHAAANRGELPDRLWTELYFQTVFDDSVAPPGRHSMSVFAQYVPDTFAYGDWDSRRVEAADRAIESIARFCTNLPAAIEHVAALGPADIERDIGLSGGHIFQGECLPQYMWDRRLAYRTPHPGVFLCGACTYPGGSVVAINGRNAAFEILGRFG